MNWLDWQVAKGDKIRHAVSTKTGNMARKMLHKLDDLYEGKAKLEENGKEGDKA